MDLGPGPLAVNSGSPFFLSTQDWTTIQQYADAGLDLQTESWFNPIRSQYPQLNQILFNLRHHCEAWTAIYWGQVRSVANDIATWASLVPDNYGALTTAASYGGAAPPPGIVSAVKSATTALGAAAAQFAQDAQTANAGIQQFLQDCLQDRTDFNEYQHTSEYANLQANLPFNPFAGMDWSKLEDMGKALNSTDGPIQSLQLVEGVWTAMQQSLQDIASQVAADGPEACAFLATIQLNTAIAEWATVGAAARAFLGGQAAGA
jgi:hypothetical protein